MNKPENLYTPLHASLNKEPAKAETAVQDLVHTFAPSANQEQSLKAVHLDASLDAVVSSRTQKNSSSKKKKPHAKSRRLNARERRALDIYSVPKEAHRYALFLPLHQLWQGYMQEVHSQGTHPSQFAQKILKADFHGALLEVVQSTHPSYVGIQGIVVQETMNSFRLITKNNTLVVIAKAACIFTMTVTCCPGTFTLYGQQLQFRAADRAVKKFKPKPSIDL